MKISLPLLMLLVLLACFGSCGASDPSDTDTAPSNKLRGNQNRRRLDDDGCTPRERLLKRCGPGKNRGHSLSMSDEETLPGFEKSDDEKLPPNPDGMFNYKPLDKHVITHGKNWGKTVGQVRAEEFKKYGPAKSWEQKEAERKHALKMKQERYKKNLYKFNTGTRNRRNNPGYRNHMGNRFSPTNRKKLAQNRDYWNHKSIQQRDQDIEESDLPRGPATRMANLRNIAIPNLVKQYKKLQQKQPRNHETENRLRGLDQKFQQLKSELKELEIDNSRVEASPLPLFKSKRMYDLKYKTKRIDDALVRNDQTVLQNFPGGKTGAMKQLAKWNAEFGSLEMEQTKLIKDEQNERDRMNPKLQIKNTPADGNKVGVSYYQQAASNNDMMADYGDYSFDSVGSESEDIDV